MIGVETILNHMTEIMILTNPKAEILFFNKAALGIQELLKMDFKKGVSFIDILPDEHKEYREFVLEEVNTKLVPQTYESALKHPLGYLVHFEVTWSPVLSNKNKIEQICITSRDITSQKSFEKKTSQLIHELSSLIENANAVIFGIDTQGYITEWNNECSRITGFEKTEVFAHSVEKIVKQGQVENFRTMIKKVLNGESVSNFEFCLRRKTNDCLTVLLNATPKVSSVGNIIGALFVGQDVTELTEYRFSLEQQVEDRTLKLREALDKEKELVEMKNKFVSIASHEFKIPLNAIESLASALKRNIPEDSLNKEKLDTIGVHVSRMKGLLEDVLNVGKYEAAKLKSHEEEIDLVSFLNGIIAEVLAAADFTHICQTEFSQPKTIIRSDEKLLRNVFINLISNAIKFSPGKNEVELKVKNEEKGVDIIVRDFGIGICKEEVEKVFEPFHRGSNTTGIKGTGLGLSIVKKAIESLGGKIRMDSVLGKGTTFTIHLKHLS